MFIFCLLSLIESQITEIIIDPSAIKECELLQSRGTVHDESDFGALSWIDAVVKSQKVFAHSLITLNVTLIK